MTSFEHKWHKFTHFLLRSNPVSDPDPYWLTGSGSDQSTILSSDHTSNHESRSLSSPRPPSCNANKTLHIAMQTWINIVEIQSNRRLHVWALFSCFRTCNFIACIQCISYKLAVCLTHFSISQWMIIVLPRKFVLRKFFYNCDWVELRSGPFNRKGPEKNNNCIQNLKPKFLDPCLQIKI